MDGNFEMFFFFFYFGLRILILKVAMIDLIIHGKVLKGLDIISAYSFYTICCVINEL